MFFLQASMCTTIFRDERHQRLAIRFSAIDKNLNIRHGRLGQHKNFGTGALAITRATRSCMVRSITSRAEMPPAAAGRTQEPKFNEDGAHQTIGSE